MANQAWKYLTGEDFYDLLLIINEDKMSFGRDDIDRKYDFDYEGLLCEFWKQSPHHLKISLKDYHCWSRLSIPEGYAMAQWIGSPLQRLLLNDPSVAPYLTQRMRTVDI
ncbi:hypothetical protein TNCT_272191 [Trichonephila clavata]|uniref:Uncharacterized protein n=1 Tax=Trichonephila clavata TaxID=2740835 RepID=A0A8X6L9E3_TRICU|nr:hypothetical protein TNCT_272191 [Trichonephila clavata]